MRISVIMPTGGNDPQRNRNFNECLQCIKNQTFTDYEVIVVEQTLDGNFYKKSNPILDYKHGVLQTHLGLSTQKVYSLH